MKDYPDISVSRAAIVAGISLIIMAILAPIANYSILNELVVPDNTAKTFINITTSEGLFRIAISEVLNYQVVYTPYPLPL